MPEELKQSEVHSHTDPSLSKQYDTETPKAQQATDLFKLIDGFKSCMLTTLRPSIGPVSRSMAIAKRSGPDLLFLANLHSTKFADLKSDKTCQVVFQDSKTQDWISLSGEATTVSNEDPRIKELYSPMVSAWFGDLGDGKHDGTAGDPRMALIEVRAKHVVYWKPTVGSLGFLAEVGTAAITGKVANTGVMRELSEQDLEQARGQEK